VSAALELVAATLGYPGRVVLEAATLEIPAGRRVALIGRNGAGKSTLLRALAGIMRPLSGRVLTHGQDLATLGPTARGKRIAYLPQQVSPEIPFTVREVVLMGRYPHRGLSLFATGKDREIVSKVIERTALADLADKRCNELSGGEFQRVLVASILAQEAPVMLLDEPTASLDLHHQSSILSMAAPQGSDGTVVIATHDLNIAAAHCSWVLVLDGGGGYTAGPTGDVLTEGFIGETFGIEVRTVLVALPSGGRRRQFVVVS
jgi:iron complex transport system ATP-binding protein